jgi:hypothetical protein
MLDTLDIIAIADQGDGSKRRKGEWSLLFVGIPDEETLNCTFIATDSALRTVACLEFFKPVRESLFKRERGNRRGHHVFSPVSVFSPVFFWR